MVRDEELLSYAYKGEFLNHEINLLLEALQHRLTRECKINSYEQAKQLLPDRSRSLGAIATYSNTLVDRWFETGLVPNLGHEVGEALTFNWRAAELWESLRAISYMSQYYLGVTKEDILVSLGESYVEKYRDTDMNTVILEELMRAFAAEKLNSNRDAFIASRRSFSAQREGGRANAALYKDGYEIMREQQKLDPPKYGNTLQWCEKVFGLIQERYRGSELECPFKSVDAVINARNKGKHKQKK